ncbi:MAG: hypothetical protein C0490_12420, partial [Marivirga sp.]|nr:hypothetical protein [Marivirga sp.]
MRIRNGLHQNAVFFLGKKRYSKEIVTSALSSGISYDLKLYPGVKIVLMWRSYIKTAWRNLVKNRTFSLINILGLALGMTSSLLILLWVNDERNIDRFHQLEHRLYTIYERQYHDGQIDAGYYTPGLLAEEMKIVFPEVQYASGMAWNELNTFEANEKILKQNGNHAGADFFKIFSYPLIQGDAANALKSSVD